MTTTEARQPFQPKGEVAEWTLLYDRVLATAGFSDVIPYAALSQALGRPFKRNRSPLYRAREHLGDTRRMWLESVPTVGYRIIEATEHARVAQQHKRKARRQLTAMVRVGSVTDLTRLSPTDLAHHDEQMRINYALFTVAVRHERRIQRIEEILRQGGLM